MKNNLLLYGLIFSVVINIFQMVNATKILKKSENEVVETKKQLKKVTDSIKKIKEDDTFSLENNNNAIEYLYPNNPEVVKQKVYDDLIELNNGPKGNKLITYESPFGGKMMISNAKFLNHRYIIANYSDGKAWGEILIKYFYNPEGKSEFETIDNILYTHTINNQ